MFFYYKFFVVISPQVLPVKMTLSSKPFKQTCWVMEQKFWFCNYSDFDPSPIPPVSMIDIWHFSRFAYDGEWKFADLLTMTAGKLAMKFVVDSVTGKQLEFE